MIAVVRYLALFATILFATGGIGCVGLYRSVVSPQLHSISPEVPASVIEDAVAKQAVIQNNVAYVYPLNANWTNDGLLINVISLSHRDHRGARWRILGSSWSTASYFDSKTLNRLVILESSDGQAIRLDLPKSNIKIVLCFVWRNRFGEYGLTPDLLTIINFI